MYLYSIQYKHYIYGRICIAAVVCRDQVGVCVYEKNITSYFVNLCSCVVKEAKIDDKQWLCVCMCWISPYHTGRLCVCA